MTERQPMPQELREIWVDAYKFHEAFEHMGNTRDDWDRCYEAAVALVDKHNGHRLATMLLVDTFIWMEEQRREETGVNETVRPIN